MNNARGVVTPFTAAAEKLSSGEFLEIVRNNVKDRTRISFTCDIAEMPDDAVIRIGHGFEISSAGWVEITKTKISAYNFYSWTDPQCREVYAPTETELTIEEFLTVSINKDVSGNGIYVLLITKGGMKKIEISGIGGSIGAIFASPLNCELENCKLNYIADGYGDPIWVIGDSYLSFPDPARWPTYLYRDGFQKVLLAG